MLQPYLVTSVIGLVQFGEKLSYILHSTCLLKLLPPEYLRETNIAFFKYHLLMVTCSLDALEKYLRKKESRIKKEQK